MEKIKTQTVEMTAEQKAKFEAFMRSENKKAEEEKAKSERQKYREMVDDEIDATIPVLLSLSESIKDTKKSIFGNFKTILDMKADVLKLTKDEQRSHTFTNSKGDKRLTLGVYVTDAYRDTVNDGILIVKEYIESLAKDKESRALVSAILRLLSKDNKGDLKASRVLQLRKMAEDSGNDRFLEGVRIIEESYQPAVSKQFIPAEIKNENGKSTPVPLGMTEAD